MAVAASESIEDAKLGDILKNIEIPQGFKDYDELSEPETVVRLEEWRRRTFAVLEGLKAGLRDRESYKLAQQGDIVGAIAPLVEERPWTTEHTRVAAKEILSSYDTPNLPLLEHCLTHKIKPLFQRNPHPDLNPSTGRKMPRPAGGTAGFQDHLEGQFWKSNLGVADLLLWCVRHTEGPMYERLWHLVIPPVMTLLDDFEVGYKLRGTQIVAVMLENVPAQILRRTGVDGLLFANLNKCLSFLDRPDSAALLRAVVPTAVKLVEHTTPPGSSQRYDQLCVVLGDGIIGGVWLHGMRQESVMQASIDVLPPLIQPLGIGSARYLKALIPQLVHPLVTDGSAGTRSMQTSSARALAVVIAACAVRAHVWKGTILAGVCRCWTDLDASGSRSDGAPELRRALQDACASLVQACPSVLEEEIPRLLELDTTIFKPLLMAVVQAETRSGTG